jgi:hypothetical protein
MEGSDLIYIVMPIVVSLALVVLIALPFVGDRGAGASHSGGGHPRGQDARGQLPDRPVAADPIGSSRPTGEPRSMS